MDTQNTPEFTEALNSFGDDVNELILDMSGLEHTSSSGICQIVAAHN